MIGTGNRKITTIIVVVSLFAVGVVTAGVMSGVIPYTLSPAKQEAPSSAVPAISETATEVRKRVGSKTHKSVNVVANTATAPAPCANCGVIETIESFTAKGAASGGGAVAGGLVGGIVGHQIGKGRGKDLATVAGAVGGAIAGHEIEKNANKVVRYRVSVRMSDGSLQQLVLANSPSAAVGDRVRNVDGVLVRD